MTIEENFNKRNSELQQKIKLEIEKVKMGQSKKNMVQLQTILTELQKSNMQKNVILSYPRIIVDSWDYSDQLGMELLELEEPPELLLLPLLEEPSLPKLKFLQALNSPI